MIPFIAFNTSRRSISELPPTIQEGEPCILHPNHSCLTQSVRRFTVPVLYDKKLDTIVNNESSEIIRIFNTAFNHLIPADKAALDYYPEELRPEIDAVNDWVYPGINSESLRF